MQFTVAVNYLFHVSLLRSYCKTLLRERHYWQASALLLGMTVAKRRAVVFVKGLFAQYAWNHWAAREHVIFQLPPPPWNPRPLYTTGWLARHFDCNTVLKLPQIKCSTDMFTMAAACCAEYQWPSSIRRQINRECQLKKPLQSLLFKPPLVD